MRYSAVVMRRVARETGIVCLYLVLAIALTWPLASNLGTAVSDLGDPLINTWILDWVCHALVHQPLDLYDAPIFYPGLMPLAYSENLVAVAVLMLPFHLAGVAPIAIHNLAVLLGFALSGYGMFVLARMITRNPVASFAAGIFYAFCPFKFDHLPHLQILFSAWVPLTLAALIAYWRRPGWRTGALLALPFVLNGLTNVYFLLFTGATTLLTVMVLAAIERRTHWRFWAGLTAAAFAAGLLLLPFLMPYRIVNEHYDMARGTEEVWSGSAVWSDWLVSTRANRLYGKLPSDSLHHDERRLFPGLLVLFLTGAAIFCVPRNESAVESQNPPLTSRRRRLLRGLDVLIFVALVLAYAGAVSDRFVIAPGGYRLLAMQSSDLPMMLAVLLTMLRFSLRLPEAFGGVPLAVRASRSRFSWEIWAAAVWIVAGVVGSLGLHTFLYNFFYQRFSPFQAMRVPSRWAIVAYVGLGVWAAVGASVLLRSRTGWKKIASSTLIIALAVVEVVPRIRWEQARPEPAPAYTWLARERVGPVLEVPLWNNGVEYLYLLGSTAHHVPIVNGVSGFAPSEQWRIRHADERNDWNEVLDLVEGYGVRLVLVHGHFLNGDQHARTAAWLRQHLATGRLVFLRRFDHENTGDYLFAVRRNLPRWQRLATANLPDPAGRFPAENLEKFLRGEATHSDTIMALLEEPREWAVVPGSLRVQGWALSPHGIERVTVILHGGKVRQDARLVERPDVKRAYTWYYMTEKPGFELVFNRRPDGIPRETTIQIEVVDRQGRKYRTADRRITWD